MQHVVGHKHTSVGGSDELEQNLLLPRLLCLMQAVCLRLVSMVVSGVVAEDGEMPYTVEVPVAGWLASLVQQQHCPECMMLLPALLQ